MRLSITPFPPNDRTRLDEALGRFNKHQADAIPNPGVYKSLLFFAWLLLARVSSHAFQLQSRCVTVCAICGLCVLGKPKDGWMDGRMEALLVQPTN